MMATNPSEVNNLTLPPILKHDDPLDPTLAALATLSLLNLRLTRLEYFLTGNADPYQTDSPSPSASPTLSVPSQLRSLESRLSQLQRLDGLPGSLVRMVDTLRRTHPEIFTPSSNIDETTSDSLSQKATQVLSHASLYTSTAARLETLQTLKIPPATQSAGIMAQQGRLKTLIDRQESLEEQAGELQARSVKALEWWVNIGIKGMGELWEDWEDRVAVCERFVKMYERRVKEENGG